MNFNLYSESHLNGYMEFSVHKIKMNLTQTCLTVSEVTHYIQIFHFYSNYFRISIKEINSPHAFNQVYPYICWCYLPQCHMLYVTWQPFSVIPAPQLMISFWATSACTSVSYSDHIWTRGTAILSSFPFKSSWPGFWLLYILILC